MPRLVHSRLRCACTKAAHSDWKARLRWPGTSLTGPHWDMRLNRKSATSGVERTRGACARLLARGYTNRQIADELVIGVRTVETHVERVLRKLGVDNRARAMLWARRPP